MSPKNFLPTTPIALGTRRTPQKAKSLIRGLENLIADLEDNNGELSCGWRMTGASSWAAKHRHNPLARSVFPQQTVSN